MMHYAHTNQSKGTFHLQNRFSYASNYSHVCRLFPLILLFQLSKGIINYTDINGANITDTHQGK